MDVPSWHPANQNSDALRRAAMSGGSASQRTEFNVVDTSTEEERQLVAKQDCAKLGGGRGLLDPSDRMYLLEQTQQAQQAKSREQLEREAALQTFRSNALKVQAHKAPVPEVPVAAPRSTPEKKESAVIVIKAKKRQAMPAGNETKAKKTRKSPKKSQTTPGSPAQDARGEEKDRTLTKANNKKKTGLSATTKSAPKSPAAALLLQDYSNSSSDEA